MTVTQFLKWARTFLGLDMRQFGALVGVSHSTVSRWENGGAPPSFEVLKRTAVELGVPVQLDLQTLLIANAGAVVEQALETRR